MASLKEAVTLYLHGDFQGVDGHLATLLQIKGAAHKRPAEEQAFDQLIAALRGIDNGSDTDDADLLKPGSKLQKPYYLELFDGPLYDATQQRDEQHVNAYTAARDGLKTIIESIRTRTFIPTAPAAPSTPFTPSQEAVRTFNAFYQAHHATLNEALDALKFNSNATYTTDIFRQLLSHMKAVHDECHTTNPPALSTYHVQHVIEDIMTTKSSLDAACHLIRAMPAKTDLAARLLKAAADFSTQDISNKWKADVTDKTLDADCAVIRSRTQSPVSTSAPSNTITAPVLTPPGAGKAAGVP